MKTILIISVTAIALLVGGVWWSNSLQESDPNTISTRGVHWHPQIEMYVKGEKQEIPADIGIGMQYAGHPHFDPMMSMTDVHTHDDSGILHWEIMEGPVTKEDVRLSVFFEIWGKTFSKDCVFEFCNDPGGTVTMLVNGKENTEFESYQVKDNDKIEIKYE